VFFYYGEIFEKLPNNGTIEIFVASYDKKKILVYKINEMKLYIFPLFENLVMGVLGFWEAEDVRGRI
jgi:hypothetical protein